MMKEIKHAIKECLIGLKILCALNKKYSLELKILKHKLKIANMYAEYQYYDFENDSIRECREDLRKLVMEIKKECEGRQQ